MPLAHVKFFAEPREYAEEVIEELRAHRLLREDAPADQPAAKDAPAVAASAPPAVKPAITPTQPAPAAVPSPSKES